jgi:formylglycine-generating enzyme required for sulfatase activity
MLPVPAGPFWMGCNDGTAGCPSNLLIEWCYLLNKPCHEVNVPAFRMDRFEVTKAAYKRFLAANPGAPPPHEDSWKDCIWARPEPEYDQHPVNCVDWRQADAYCRWAGGGRRLCTEAEWEKAARGTDGRRYPWGNQPPTCELAVIGQGGEAGLGCGTGMTWPVGSKPLGASAYRIEDMAGNVWEWVADCFTWITGSGIPGYEGAPTDGSAVLDCESEVDPVRIQRGGAFHLDPADAIQLSVLTAYWRSGSLELGWSWLDGFRCCRSR